MKDIKKTFDLEKYCDRKSFYKKCGVDVDEDGTLYLWSYGTYVGYFDGDFHRTWGGYSSTTMRHVNAFMDYLWYEMNYRKEDNGCGYPTGGKAWWDKLAVEKVK